ncbi:hypothetical protein TVAG_295060 [Trichomonas vaginalis G3]|uniref:Armadillo/beta-catenin-like repeat family protein n=1 Tax=Trichomonas vaginalis (strain ATCC PRA-98 / G3) TaxID=412133 RepID=A2DL63_TRIV3|nr:armadillo (ARM) repeat-containing protein family [Trichomonas vaginalis G3]EAY18854.1 hypothetical protein TVAG_295060 [Trichomonas vaginalis G3]KAI5526040.1 armadillo (ARM) repeat-containing protein family [Trichomonas vaginalis G3]|eukprot:XP_001579840.1 hypothetical protein [Trichomonas vaginalis G3]
MEYKKDIKLDLNSDLEKLTLIIKDDNEQINAPESLCSEIFNDFPYINDIRSMNFTSIETFKALIESEFVDYFCEKLYNHLNNNSGKYQNNVFRKKATDPSLILSNICLLFSSGPYEFQMELINRNYPKLLVRFLNSANTQEQFIILRSISHTMGSNEEIIAYFVQNMGIQPIIDILENTSDDKVRKQAAYILTQFLKIELIQALFEQITDLLLTTAKKYHEIYNYYLVLALHNVSLYNPSWLLVNNKFLSLQHFISISDEAISAFACDAITRTIQVMDMETFQSFIVNCQIWDKITMAIIKNERITVRKSILVLAISIIQKEPESHILGIEAKFFITIGQLLATSSHEIKHLISLFFIDIYEYLGNTIFEIVSVEFEMFSTLCSLIQQQSFENLPKLIIMLGNHVKHTENFPAEYAEEYKEALIDAIDTNDEIADLAITILDDLFGDKNQD